MEEVFMNRPEIRYVESGERRGEDVYAALGQIFEGRYLLIYFILKRNRTALILSARDMDRQERRLYERK